MLRKAGFGTSKGLNFNDNEMDLGTDMWWNRFLLRNGHDLASHGPRTAHLREQSVPCVSSVPNVPNVLKEQNNKNRRGSTNADYTFTKPQGRVDV